MFRPAHAPDPAEAAARRLEAWKRRKAAEDAAAGIKAPSPDARGYDKDWRMVRASVLAAEPWCRMCAERGIQTQAKLVDHIVTVRERPDLRLNRANLQPLCWPCHNGKTIRHDGGLGRPKRPAR
jgi:5-methylcytosine-specific restriction enzyme A